MARESLGALCEVGRMKALGTERPLGVKETDVGCTCHGPATAATSSPRNAERMLAFVCLLCRIV